MARNKPSTPIENAKPCKGGKGKGKPGSKPKGQKRVLELNVRQLRFAEFVAGGMPASRAYKAAGYNSAGNSAEANASTLIRNQRVAEHIAKLRAPETKKALMTRDRKREFLRDVIENPNAGLMVKMRAIELDAKLAGDFAPEKVEVETGPKTLDAIAERAASVASALDRNAALRARGTSARKPAGLARWTPDQ